MLPAMRVAVLGTGKMGGAMARRLSASGLEVAVWNRTRARAEALGVGIVHDTPAAAAVEAEIVISMLTGPPAVQAAYFGAGGALEAAAGRLFVEMSTAGPEAVTSLAARLGSNVIDAPVMGSVPAVEAGQLAILVGGDAEAVARARPVLEKLGEPRHVGPLGSGARLKLVANSMLAGISALAAELQRAGTAAGLPPEDVFWVLQRFAPYLNARKRGYLEDVHEPVMFALRDIVKDLDLALGMFSQPVPATELARALFAEAAKTHGGLDLSAIASRG